MTASFSTSLEGVLEWLIETIDGVRASGPTGWLLFALIYGVATLLTAPSPVLLASAGFLYGPVAGLLTGWVLSTVFGSVNFGLGRTVLRGVVQRRATRWPRLQAVDRAIGRRGLWLVMLLRCSPTLPHNFVSYLLGMTRVAPRDLVLGTALGGLLPAALYSWIGAQAADLSALTATPAPIRWLGLGLTAAALIASSLVVRRALGTALEPTTA